MQQAFDKMSLLIAADALAANPDHNTRFDIFTKASDFQIGACIVQEGRPDAYFSCKIAEIYCYVETMISIVATLKEFWGMLIGAKVLVFTDHKTTKTRPLTL